MFFFFGGTNDVWRTALYRTKDRRPTVSLLPHEELSVGLLGGRWHNHPIAASDVSFFSCSFLKPVKGFSFAADKKNRLHDFDPTFCAAGGPHFRNSFRVGDLPFP
ncbi:unnamed protein product, partial [Ectocarpus fasciculatus]